MYLSYLFQLDIRNSNMDSGGFQYIGYETLIIP